MITIDYHRVKNNKFPLFTVKITKQGSNKEFFVGSFYQVKRIYKNNRQEKLAASKEVSFGPWFFSFPIKYKYSILDRNIEFEVERKEHCLKEKDFYFSYNDFFFNKACLDEVYLISKSEKKVLRDSIISDEFSLNQILGEAISFKEEERHILYNYEDFNILVCDPILYSDEIQSEVIIAHKKLNTQNLCNNNPCSFTKTFKVIHKQLSMEEEYGTVTLEQSKNGRFTTVRLHHIHLLDLELNKNYNFRFINTKRVDLDDNNIEELFQYLEIFKVEESKSFLNEKLCY